MEARIHVRSHRPPPRPDRWVGLGRVVALLTVGIGIGVLATIPFAGGATIPTVVAVLAASAAGGIAYLRPGRASTLAAVDLLLGLAVLATVFGHLGVLYLPSLLVFLAVTARSEPATQLDTEQDAEVSSTGSPLDDIESEFLADDSVMASTSDALTEPVIELSVRGREPGRHRAPSMPRRVAATTLRAGRAVGDVARAGARNARQALVSAPADDEAEEATPVPSRASSWDRTYEPPPAPPEILRRSLGDELREELEARELETVAEAKSWSSFSHRAYGELRSLPLRLEPREADPPTLEIDDEQWSEIRSAPRASLRPEGKARGAPRTQRVRKRRATQPSGMQGRSNATVFRGGALSRGPSRAGVTARPAGRSSPTPRRPPPRSPRSGSATGTGTAATRALAGPARGR